MHMCTLLHECVREQRSTDVYIQVVCVLHMREYVGVPVHLCICVHAYMSVYVRRASCAVVCIPAGVCVTHESVCTCSCTVTHTCTRLHEHVYVRRAVQPLCACQLMPPFHMSVHVRAAVHMREYVGVAVHLCTRVHAYMSVYVRRDVQLLCV